MSWFMFIVEVLILGAFVFDSRDSWEFPRLKEVCSKIPKIKIN